MSSRTRYIAAALMVTVACALSYGAGVGAQQESIEGHVYQSPGGTQLEVLLDGRGRDGNVDVAEITFSPGTNSGDHPHASTEIFYVLEGQLEHVVNGESRILEPGMLGLVEPPDVVNHITQSDGTATRAVVIWAPGGEAARLASRWSRVR